MKKKRIEKKKKKNHDDNYLNLFEKIDNLFDSIWKNDSHHQNTIPFNEINHQIFARAPLFLKKRDHILNIDFIVI